MHSLFSKEELDTFQRVDNEVETLKNHIYQLWSHRNTLSPTYRFPPEVLARIFSHVIVQDWDRRPSRQRIRVTHVSRYWRTTALTSPTLWTDVMLDHPDAVSAWLKRSGQCSLSITLTKSFSNHCLPALRSTFLEHHRIWKMVFELSSLPSGTRDLLRDEIQAGLGRPTPILQSLTMVQVPSSSLTVQQTLSSAQNPFSGHAPRLRTIDLQKSDFNFDSSAFCHLTWLSIVDPIRRSTVDVFLRAVREMSELRYLKLQNVFGRGTSIQFDGRVDLPHLVDLIIHEFGGSVQEDFTFLEHLTIPPATHLTLFSHIRSFNEAAFPRFTYIYARARRSFLDIPISTLHFKWLGDTFHLKVWIYSPRTGSLIQTLCLGFIGLRRTPARSCLWANELSYWPLAELRAFETNCDLGFESWKHTFGALQGLRTIHVEGNYAGYGFLQYLVHNHEHDCPLPDEIELRDPDGDPASDLRSWSKVAFPNLTDLRLMGISFDTTVDVRRLLNSLCARQDQGFGLDELTIFDCTAVGFENMVESLDTIVPAITWDGWQR